MKLQNDYNMRKVAFEMALNALLDKSHIDKAISQHKSYTKLSVIDKRFTSWLVFTYFRYKNRISDFVFRYIKKNTHPKLCLILQLATIEILMGKSPTYAIVNEYVKLAHIIAKPQKPLINAVLREILRDLESNKVKKKYILADVKKEYPKPLLEALQKQFNEGDVNLIIDNFLREAAADISIKEAKNSEVITKLPKAIPLPGGGARMKRMQSELLEMDSFKQGDMWIQDAAAQVPIKALKRTISDLFGLDVLDLCAAPGGKTMQLASFGAKVTAVDVSSERLERLTENMERCQFDVEVINSDIDDLSVDNKYDVVSLDAPCSATGTIRRHPEILYNFSDIDIKSLVAAQAKFFNKAALMVKPHGYLLYMVCSLLPEEGSEQVKQFLQANSDFKFVNQDKIITDLKVAHDSEPDIGYTLHPGLWSKIGAMDGFFWALLQKVN